MGILKPRDVCGFLGGGSTSEEGYNYTGERERERERERELELENFILQGL